MDASPYYYAYTRELPSGADSADCHAEPFIVAGLGKEAFEPFGRSRFEVTAHHRAGNQEDSDTCQER